MRRWVIAAVLLLLAAACATVIDRRVSPHLTIRQAQAAIRDHDLRALERYLDIYAVARQLDEAMPRDLPELRARNVFVDIPVGTFAPQFLRQFEAYVADGSRPATPIAAIFDTIADGEFVEQIDNADGSRTVTLRRGSDEVRLVLVRDGVIWRITSIADLKLPLPPDSRASAGPGRAN